MKTRNLFLLCLITLLFSGCFLYSFYPLYNKSDLFPNSLLLGEWISDDSEVWKFNYSHLSGKKNQSDSTSYVLTVQEEDENEPGNSTLDVHILKLGGHYFLDFYPGKFDAEKIYDFHFIPVHTFAKVEFKDDKAIIKWFDPEWLKELIEQNKIRIRHEENEMNILLTASTKELQKFVTKYVNSEDAFSDDLKVVLSRKAE